MLSNKAFLIFYSHFPFINQIGLLRRYRISRDATQAENMHVGELKDNCK